MRVRLRDRRWLVLGRDVALFALVYFALQAYQQRGAASGPAPAFEATALDGSAVSLVHYRGRPLLLCFWATWCRVCQAEQSNLVAVSRDLPVLTVASQSGPAAHVAAYLRERGLSLKVVVDTRGELARRFGVRAFPTSFVIDARGIVRQVEVGYTTELGLRLRMWLARL